MAKYVRKLKGNFNEILEFIHRDITDGSISASYEDGNSVVFGDVKVETRVYERYSILGGNRVSMNLTVTGSGKDINVCAITSGGSQAIFFKFNTFGEETFLEICKNSIDNYVEKHRSN